ncbi:MAG: glycosyltransferase [Oscillospiraceae bacterium]|jgi:glycosyltransferase involved in cell wall biosynthesis|nr:glycosyltransferase [Oscillospiraceae bacterium]
MNPIISVIVPVFNAAAYLDECVHSVLAQRFAQWELLLVDDGSADASPGLCDQWAARDPRIHAIHQPNGGVSAARNAGLALARGEYLAFLDADDCLTPDFLAVLYEQAEDHAADLSICTFRNFAQGWEGDAVACPGLPAGGFDRRVILGDMALLLMRFNCCNSICTKLFRRSIVEENALCLPPGRTHGEDREFLLRYLAHCGRAAYTPQALYRYRVVPGSAVNALRHEPAERIWQQHLSDLPLFEALGVSAVEARLHCREGVAVETFHEIWRLARARGRRTAMPQLRRLLQSEPMKALLAMPPELFAVVFPGRLAHVVRTLAAKRRAMLLALLIRLFSPKDHA